MSTAFAIDPAVQWQCRIEVGTRLKGATWADYLPDDNYRIETAFLCNLAGTDVWANSGDPRTINFQTFMQVNAETRTERPIRRLIVSVRP